MNAVPILLWQLSLVYSRLNTLRKLRAASGSDPTSSSLHLSTSSFLVYMHQHTCSRFGRCHYTNLLRSLHHLILISSWIYTPLWMLRLCCWAFRITSFRLGAPREHYQAQGIGDTDPTTCEDSKDLQVETICDAFALHGPTHRH